MIKKKKTAIILFFYPERTLQKAISKLTVRNFIVLGNRKQGQSYTFEPSTTVFVPSACFYICFQPFFTCKQGILLNLQAVYL